MLQKRRRQPWSRAPFPIGAIANPQQFVAALSSNQASGSGDTGALWESAFEKIQLNQRRLITISKIALQKKPA
jgi:hypothetical protein